MASGNTPKRIQKGPMDRWLEKGVSFVSKYPKLFQGYTFTFKGYVPAVRKALEDVVKKMSGTVSENSGYLMTDQYTFALANDGRPHHSIKYLAHSIKAKKPLDINIYRFVPLKKNAANLNCHCLEIRYILGAKYWPNDKFKNVKCSLCHEAESLGLADSKGDEVFVVEEYMS